jgi:hypothetical protein
MLPILLAVAMLVAFSAGILILGEGDWRRGSLRLVRRIRTVRRQQLPPVLQRLAHAVSGAWDRPARQSVASQLRRVASRVEGAGAAAEGFVRAQQELTRGMDRLRAAAMPADWAEPRSYPPSGREMGDGRGWMAALLLVLTAAGLGAANAWVLTVHVLPGLPTSTWFPLDIPVTVTVSAAVSGLAFLLGIEYYALNEARGRDRLFRTVVAMLIGAIMLAEGTTTVASLEALAIVELTWWGGFVVAGLLGGAAALAPAVLAALGHASIERFEQWSIARDRRAARRAVKQQRETARGLRESLGRMESRVMTLRSDLTTLSSEGAGRLLFEPGERLSVERAAKVLRRLAAAVEADPELPAEVQLEGGVVASRLIRDWAALVIWVGAAGAALSLVLPAVGQGVVVGTSTVLAVGALAGLATLLVGGSILRWILGRIPDTGTNLRAALVLVLGLAAASFGAALGPAVVRTGVLDVGVVTAAAWLNLVVLVAALASVRLPEGLRATAALATVLVAGTAWLVVRVFDLLLLGVDGVLTAFGGGGPPPPPAPTRPEVEEGPRLMLPDRTVEPHPAGAGEREDRSG